jgi:hypothetical protein
LATDCNVVTPLNLHCWFTAESEHFSDVEQADYQSSSNS